MVDLIVLVLASFVDVVRSKVLSGIPYAGLSPCISPLGKYVATMAVYMVTEIKVKLTLYMDLCAVCIHIHYYIVTTN